MGLARLSIPVALLSFLLMRFGGLHPAIALYCFATAIALAVLSLLVSIAAFPAIWIDGQKGGRRLWGAFLRGLFVLVPALVLLYYYLDRPAYTDLSTNLENPPIYVRAWQERLDFDNSLNIAPLAEREARILAYPDLVSKSIDQSPQLIYLLVQDIIKDRGWTILQSQAPSEDNLNGRIETTTRSVITGLRYAVVVRIEDNGNEGSLLDMRSASLWGRHDLGVNADRIKSFYADVNEKLGQGLKLYKLELEEQERQERLKRGPVPRNKPGSPKQGNSRTS